jgi:tRNA (mo5U34)-methyltransferase
MDWSVKKIITQSSGLFDFSPLFDRLSGEQWKGWQDALVVEIADALEVSRNGHLPLWTQVYDALPVVAADQVMLDQSVIKVRSNQAIDDGLAQSIEKLLLQLVPWRKGPFRIHQTTIEAEWQSNQKWDRIKDAISPLSGRTILDVGCGNGYYALRMVGEGAKSVIGVDPYLRYIVQFRLLCHFLGASTEPAQLAPVGFERIPRDLQCFDTVFSMGVIYHQRSPFEHLERLFETLRSGGELVLESIVVEGNEQTVLVPERRYCKMRNVWCLPSPLALERWLKRCGFVDVRLANLSTTTMVEQRATRWMPFESLADFLDPNDRTRSIEGYPAPKRAVLIARKP